MLQVASSDAQPCGSASVDSRGVTILVFSTVRASFEDLAGALSGPGCRVIVSESAADASERFVPGQVDVLVVDLAAPEALKFLRKRAASRGCVPIICVADRRRPEASFEALRLGAIDIVARPVRIDDLMAALANAFEFVRTARRGHVAPDLPEISDGLFGASSAMREVLGVVGRVAPSRCGVLVVGERGTGRETIARAIHAHGPRRDKPFIRIVCSDSGSTGSVSLAGGSAPPGSTVYLEDLGDLGLQAQSWLEALLSAPEGTPGHDAEAPRFVASALPTIFDSAARGAIRRDLLDAIGVVRIDLPPLRQRSADIPQLAMYFLKRACRQGGVPPKTFSRSALTLLAALPWPGNMAELRSLTDRLAVLVPRGVVLLEDVLANVRFDHAKALGRPRESLRVARERFERDYVSSVLQHHRGRMAEAARELGIERTNLYRKIRQLSIRWAVSS